MIGPMPDGPTRRQPRQPSTSAASGDADLQDDGLGPDIDPPVDFKTIFSKSMSRLAGWVSIQYLKY